MDRAIRMWKRDRTVNEMSIESALGNLEQNRPDLDKGYIKTRFMEGSIIHTPLARLKLKGEIDECLD